MKGIIQPGGLGDIIICQGIANTMGVTHWPVMTGYCQEVFRHFPQFTPITIVPSRDNMYSSCISALRSMSITNIADVYLGFPDAPKERNDRFLGGDTPFDKFKYQLVGVDFEAKWSHFEWKRFPEQEDALMKYYNPNEPYIFVHDISYNSVWRDRLSIATSKRVIKPDAFQGITVLDYYKLMAGADEIHCLDSSFANFVDVSGINAKKFIHWYARETTAVPEQKKILGASLRGWIDVYSPEQLEAR